MLMHIAVWPHASRGEELQTDSTCVRNLCILQRAQGWFEKHQKGVKRYQVWPETRFVPWKVGLCWTSPLTVCLLLCGCENTGASRVTAPWMLIWAQSQLNDSSQQSAYAFSRKWDELEIWSTSLQQCFVDLFICYVPVICTPMYLAFKRQYSSVNSSNQFQ